MAKKITKKKATAKAGRKQKLSSKQIQLAVSKKVTDRHIFRELHYFCTLDKVQLKARLKKLKTPASAEAFRIMAKIAGMRMMAVHGRNRRDELYA